MSGIRNNFTFLWVTLAFVLLPALVQGIPISIVEQHVYKLDPLEEIVPEEPLPLTKVEEDLPAITSAPTIQSLSLPSIPEVPLTEEVVAVDETENVQLVQTISTSINEVGEKEPIPVMLSGQKITLTASAKALPIKDETNLPIEKIDKPPVLSTNSVPVFEELITTKSISDHKQLKMSDSHKKQALLKILDKIVSEVLIEECNLSVTALAADHEELEELTPNEEKLLLRRVIKALDRYLLLLEKKVENFLVLEEPKSSSVKQVVSSVVPKKLPFKLTKSPVVTKKRIPTNIPKQYLLSAPEGYDDMFAKYFRRPSHRSEPRIG